MYDIIVIGGGVVGTMILRELSRYKVKALLLEAGYDVAVGASRANSGIVHAGYDCKPGTYKARFNVEGNAMYPALTEELHVPYKKTGSIVVAPEDGKKGIEELYAKGVENGVKVEILERKRIEEIEPNVADDIKYALYSPEAGIVSPYKLTIAAADSAIINGAEIKLNERVTVIDKLQTGYRVKTPSGSYTCKVLINSAGANAIEINKLLGDLNAEVEYRRGDYYVLDKSEINTINTVLFPLPDHRGKGILVAPTADGNVIYGPNSVLTSSGDDTAVTPEGLEEIKKGLSKTYKAASLRKVIRLFAGVRAAVGEDFIIRCSEINPGFIILAGICSPGLTSSPAIAKYVAEELVPKFIPMEKKESFKPLEKHKKLALMTAAEINAEVGKNPLWGRVICRCERVSEAEIVEAIHSPLPATTVDGVKRRVRAGMGRCQGGFCMPSVIKIISRELNVPITDVRKGGDGSGIAVEKIEVSK